MSYSLIEIGSKTAEKNSAQTNRQTDRHYENNGHLAVNQYISSLTVSWFGSDLVALWDGLDLPRAVRSALQTESATFIVVIFGRPFVKRFALWYRTVVCPVLSCLSCLSVLWPNGWMHQDATWCRGRPRPRPHCVRWGPSSPRKGHSTPHFSAHVYCGQAAGWIRMPLGMNVGLGPGHIVLDEDPALST